MSTTETHAGRAPATERRPDDVPTGIRREDAVPDELSRSRLRRRIGIVAGIAVAAVMVVTLTPGLESLRSRFAHAAGGWLALGFVLKLLSGLSYVVVFRAVFCNRMPWRLSYKIGMSELGANALVPTGGAGGLALGAWALRRGGLPSAHIARRTVAFFFLTSAANVAAVVLVGVGLAVGLLPGHVSLALTLVPAAIALSAFFGTFALGRFAARLRQRQIERGAGSRQIAVLAALAEGIEEAFALLRARDGQLIAGAIGYLAFDIFVLWATFHAFGSGPEVSIIWIAYLIGELGGLLPVPGGIGGVDAGLIGTFVLYGIAVTPATAAVLAYRAIALWVPALFGSAAFVALRRTLRDDAEPHLAECVPCAEAARLVAAA